MPRRKAVTETSETSEIIETPTLQQQMQAKCLDWQKRLRLADWNIGVRVVPAMEMERPDLRGCIEWHTHEKAATISLVHPDDATRQGGIVPYIIEDTLLHELLHLHLLGWQTDSDRELAELEFAINAIAGCIYELRPQ